VEWSHFVVPEVAQISKSAVSPNCIRPGIERNGVRDDMSAIFAATYCRLEICDTAESLRYKGNPLMSTLPGIRPD
jgi:hypothetical protein